MDIVVKGRKAEVSDKFRHHAAEKLGKMERLDHRIIRLEVEVSEERNPRLSDTRQRVEVTCLSKGPVIRAEAAATDPYAALDLAVAKLEGRLRRAADKRRVHHGMKSPDSVHATTAQSVPLREPVAAPPGVDSAAGAAETAAAQAASGAEEDEEAPSGEFGFVVREKIFESRPMSIQDALFEMELVGHDFFLFADADTGLPSVVYRRKGYDYGVIRLKQ